MQFFTACLFGNLDSLDFNVFVCAYATYSESEFQGSLDRKSGQSEFNHGFAAHAQYEFADVFPPASLCFSLLVCPYKQINFVHWPIFETSCRGGRTDYSAPPHVQRFGRTYVYACSSKRMGLRSDVCLSVCLNGYLKLWRRHLI